MGRASLLGGGGGGGGGSPEGGVPSRGGVPPTPFIKRRFGPAPLGLRYGPMYM